MGYMNTNYKRNKYIPLSSKGKKKYFSWSKITPSEAERIIIKILRKNKIKFEREVSFYDFKNENGNFYRFDFFFPSLNMIIEYDGAEFHLENNIIDKLKNQYCKDKKIKLIRLNKQHYYIMEEVLKNIFK